MQGSFNADAGNGNGSLNFPINMQNNTKGVMGVQFVQDSMQCSEVLTMNQTNPYILGSMNQMSTNSDNLSNNNFSQRFNNNDSAAAVAQFDHNQHRKQQVQAKENEKKSQQNLLKEFDTLQFKYSNDEQTILPYDKEGRGCWVELLSVLVAYSYQINLFCKRIAAEKHASDVACKFPLYKMIRSIVKKFLFNELELIFFGYVLEESKWKVDDIEVRKHAYFMNDFLNITEVKDLLDYKSVLLYLILTAYGVKYYLNEETEMKMFGQHMNTIVKDFTTLFSYWSKNYGSTSFKIIPKSLNRVYRNLSKRTSEQNKKQHEDYNALVDAIIQISPPYNNEKPLDQSPEHSPIHAKPSNKRKKSPSHHDKNSMSDLSSSNVWPTKSVDQMPEPQKKKGKGQQQPHSPLLSHHKIDSNSNNNSEQQQQQQQTSSSFGNAQKQQQQQQSQGSAKFGHSPTSPANAIQDLTDFSVDYNASHLPPSQQGNTTGLLQNSQNVDDNGISSKIIQGFGSANFADNMEFFSNLNNPLNSNNHYNFNNSYPSLNLGQLNNYSQFLPQSQLQIDHGNHSLALGQQQQLAKSVKTSPNRTSTNGNTNNTANQVDFTSSFAGGTSQIQSSALGIGQIGIGNLQGQSSFFNNHTHLPFSSGYIGQGNNSFNSNQIGFSHIYSQISVNNPLNQENLLPGLQGALPNDTINENNDTSKK